MDAKETISNYWDWRSQTYNNGRCGFHEEEKSVWKKELRPFLKCEKDLNILDVGTGPGFLALILAEMGHNVTGVDISKGMLQKARDNARAMNLKIDFCHADGEKLPFDEESFDLIVNRHLLWTLPDPKRAAEEWARVLKQKGRILAIDGAWFDPSMDASFRRLLSKAATIISDGKIPSFFSVFGKYYNPIRKVLPLYSNSKPNRICSLFEEIGLSNISYKYLLDVHQFQNSSATFLYRIAHNEPTFLVMCEKSKLLH